MGEVWNGTGRDGNTATKMLDLKTKKRQILCDRRLNGEKQRRTLYSTEQSIHFSSAIDDSN